MGACVYACIYGRVSLNACICLCMRACVYVCMRVSVLRF